MIKISQRLKQVAELVPEGMRLADVGTDHGYVPIWLLQQGRIPSAIAMDVNKGPLIRAEENRAKYGLDRQIELRQSDGLEKLKPGETDVVLIAGMGGPLMIRILEEGRAAAECISAFVLQPQSEIPSVRRYLIRNGYDIEEEIMLIDEGKYYMGMKAVHRKVEEWSEAEYLFGKKLLESGNDVLFQFMLKEQKLYTKILNQLNLSGQEDSERYREVVDYLKELENGICYFK